MRNIRQFHHRNRSSCCALCGERLPSDRSQYIIGFSGRAVCAECLQATQRLLPSQAPPPQPLHAPVLTPNDIMQRLDRTIIGQADAKRAVATLLWKQQLCAAGQVLPRASLLLIGPSGCGKTALVREAARIVDLPFLSFDATTLTETGYRGRDATEMIGDLLQTAGTAERAEHGVILLDEFDKLSARGPELRAVYQRGTQHALLKLIEGTEVTVNDQTIRTDNILFLFGGAFEGLTPGHAQVQPAPVAPIGFGRTVEKVQPTAAPSDTLMPDDLIKWGISRELMGRIGRITQLRALTADDLEHILLHSDLSVFRSYQQFFLAHGHRLDLDTSARRALIDDALSRGMGARGLNALVEAWIEPKLRELAEELAYGA